MPNYRAHFVEEQNYPPSPINGVIRQELVQKVLDVAGELFYLSFTPIVQYTWPSLHDHSFSDDVFSSLLATHAFHSGNTPYIVYGLTTCIPFLQEEMLCFYMLPSTMMSLSL